MSYGIQIANSSNELINITDRKIMVSELISVRYGENGYKVFPHDVYGFSVEADYHLDPASDGKVIRVSRDNNRINWYWDSSKAILPSDARIVVFSGV